jgi:hypothetical protein
MSDLLESRDIFYPPNFGRFGREASFSTPTGDCTSVRRLFAFSSRSHQAVQKCLRVQTRKRLNCRP